MKSIRNELAIFFSFGNITYGKNILHGRYQIDFNFYPFKNSMLLYKGLTKPLIKNLLLIQLLSLPLSILTLIAFIIVYAIIFIFWFWIKTLLYRDEADDLASKFTGVIMFALSMYGLFHLITKFI